MFFYSPSRNAFYPSEFMTEYLAAEALPDDIMEVSDSAYAAIVSNRPPHLDFAAGPDGHPVLIERVVVGYVPPIVSRAQGKIALLRAGRWGDVAAFVAAIPDATARAVAEVALNETATWNRSSPFLAQVAAGVGLSDEDLDALFLAAAEVTL